MTSRYNRQLEADDYITNSPESFAEWSKQFLPDYSATINTSPPNNYIQLSTDKTNSALSDGAARMADMAMLCM